MIPSAPPHFFVAGADLDDYVANLGWKLDPSTDVIELPSNPDNQVVSTVVQENIKLPRAYQRCRSFVSSSFTVVSVNRAIEGDRAHHASDLMHKRLSRPKSCLTGAGTYDPTRWMRYIIVMYVSCTTSRWG